MKIEKKQVEWRSESLPIYEQQVHSLSISLIFQLFRNGENGQ